MAQNGTDMEVEAKQVQVRFTTKLPSALRVATTPFMLPAHLKRYGLSEVVNTLLGLETPKPFDFLVDGELLRTSLENFLLSRKLSIESILTLEYIPAVLPPNLHTPHVHDDWVSSVDGSHARFLFTGCYDGFARAWDGEGTCLATFSGHKDCVTAVRTVGMSGVNDVKVVTASKDRSLMLWQMSVQDETLHTVRPLKVFKGHRSSVQTVAASPSGNEICSGSWDTSIRIWQVAIDPDQDTDIKRRKLSDTGSAEISCAQEAEATRILKGHTQCVSAIVWRESDSIHSASWDHSLRIWDVETGANTSTMNCTKALHCLSVGGESSSMLASGGADHVLRIWDPRLPGGVTPALQLSSHKGWITACGWHKISQLHLLSASHDGTIKLWDTRSKIPLHTLEGHKDKVLSADWWKDNSLISGGADSQLLIFSGLKLG